MLSFVLLAPLALSGLAGASPVKDKLAVKVKEQITTVNGTVEYSTMCKTCPYNLCPNVEVPDGGQTVTLTCWANGDTVGDTKLWLKTTSNCYISEYDLVEYAGDFSKDLKTCGNIPQKITKQAAKVKYLSECKWGRDTSDESIAFYGRDKAVTLTCWAEGGQVLNDNYWYKTTDNCHVSGTGLYTAPNRGALDNCGPESGPRINETKRATDEDDAPFTLEDVDDDVEEDDTEEDDDDDEEIENKLARRWLQPGLIGEEYSACRSCASPVTSASCKQVKRYEYNQTINSQCYKNGDYTWPNGTVTSYMWMYTVDWCWVDGNDFWEPPWDHYRYPACDKWGIS